MPTFRHGKVTRVFFGGYDLTQYMRSVDISRTTDTAETTAFMSTSKTYVLGEPGATAHGEGMFSHSTAPSGDMADVLDAAFAQEGDIPLTVAYDSGVLPGKLAIGGPIKMSNHTVNGSITDLVGIQADWQFNGGAFGGLNLNGPDSNVAFSGSAISSAFVDYSPYTYKPANIDSNVMPFGGFGVLHVIGNTVNAAINVTLQSSSTSGGTYTDFCTFTAIGANTIAGETVQVARNVTVNKFLKVRVATTGSGNLKFLSYFAPVMQ